MSSDIFLLDIPNFKPKYKENEIYGYKGVASKNLKAVLTESSKGYCMYCYSKILVDRKNFGQLEHSIEKFNSNKLINCIGNISITCSTCNNSFKKKGEKLRGLTSEEINAFEAISECGVTCVSECSKYNELRHSYIKKNTGEIILQPFGIKNRETKNTYLIQYDILKQKFIPKINIKYKDEEILFIEKHINRFNLNDAKYRTQEFLFFIEDVIEYNAIPKANRYCNLVVEIFLEHISKIPKEKAIKICKVIYTQLVILNKN